MRLILAVAAAAALTGACSPDSDKTNPAVATDAAVAEREAAAPAAGATSFTEGQARDRIVAAGYSDVTNLTKSEDGVWRGAAMMSGQSTTVMLDYQGNVTAGPAPAMTAPAEATTPGMSTTPPPAGTMTPGATTPSQPAMPAQPAQ